jgi:hypothetical protein
LTRAERNADPFFVQRRKIHDLVVKDDLQGALEAYEALKSIESRLATRPDVEVINLLLHRAAKECKLVRGWSTRMMWRCWPQWQEAEVCVPLSVCVSAG